jgi:hypothetical protein
VGVDLFCYFSFGVGGVVVRGWRVGWEEFD